MKVIVTTAGHQMGRMVAEYLADRHEVELLRTDGEPDSGSGAGACALDLCGDALDDAVCGADAIIHTANFTEENPAEPAWEREILLQATLGTYRLCTAARQAGVDRVIVPASLNVFDSVPERYLVDEMWRPRPEPDVRHLAPHLAAQCAREFVREGGLRGICLRLLPIGDDPERNTPAGYLLHAVDRALQMTFGEQGHRWHVYHIAPARRFLMRDAVRQLGFSFEEAQSCPQ